MFCHFFALLPPFLFVRALFGKTATTLGHMKPGRTHRSRSRRHPCTLERVAGAQRFFSGGSGEDVFPGSSTRGLTLYVRTGMIMLMLSVLFSRLS